MDYIHPSMLDENGCPIEVDYDDGYVGEIIYRNTNE